jgi:uncharacterized repeat protein (TIGR01451 family)
MKRVVVASLGAVALIASLPFVSQISALAPINSGSIAAAKNPQKQGLVQVRLEGEKQVMTKDEQGKEKITWQALDSKSKTGVKTGDVIRYTVIAENTSNKPIKNLALKGPVPNGTAFILKSVNAPNNAKITYSIDGAKSFTDQPKITDGKATKDAPAEKYTHVRVSLPVILPKATVQATYETQVR